MGVVVVLRSARAVRAFAPQASQPEILGVISEWLSLAVGKAEAADLCFSFAVEIHVPGAGCDHERPRPRGE